MNLSFSDVTTWRLLADTLLMGTLLYFCVRSLRSPTNPKTIRQVGELESTLKGLIREAEASGKGLNDQLLRRQDALEKVLLDLETAEQRITRGMKGAEDTGMTLEHAVGKAHRAIKQLAEAIERSEEALANIPKNEPIIQVEIPKPPSFEEAVRVQPKRETRERSFELSRSVNERSFDPQPLEEAPPPRSRPLAASVERHVDRVPSDPMPLDRSIGSELAKVYSAAEQMLRAGEDLHTVHRRTRLPMEQVQRLSQLVNQEDIEEEQLPPPQKVDPRLGVLGGASRRNSTPNY